VRIGTVEAIHNNPLKQCGASLNRFPEIDSTALLPENWLGNINRRPLRTPPVPRKRRRGEGGIKVDLRIRSQNDKMMLRSRDMGREEVWGLAMTLAERHVYLIIEVFWEKYGYSPSYEDIAYLRGVKGIGNIKRIVDKLVQMGAVKRIPGAKRSVRPVWLKFRNLD
jgi:hypothetical protein